MEPVTVKKFCLLTPKSMPEEVTRRLKVEIEQHIASFAKPFTLTLSLDHWKAEFPRLGGWKEWQAALAGNSPMTGKPSFDAFIAPEGTTGRATSDIVATAVGRGASLFETGQELNPQDLCRRTPRPCLHAQGPTQR